jgi:hypothetical protein
MIYSDELAQTLASIDTFHKNLLLLFDDFSGYVRDKTYAGTLQNLTGPENVYGVWNANESEHMRLWVFNHNDRIRFAVMLIKVHDRHLRGNSTLYKAMCSQLGRDPKFPLLLIYGIFEPRDIRRFLGDQNVRRHWVLNAVLIDIRQEQKYPQITEFRFGDTIILESTEGTDSYWCEKAQIVFCDLTTITDTGKLSHIASHLLNM